MKFGIFDQNDNSGRPLHQQMEERLQLAELYDSAGFHCYHMSEHHATPLNMAPSPSVFLSALAQRTKRLRFGPLVYILPLHHPLRLAEEICMLDHLSRGRVEFGVGRGASPHEIAYFAVDPEEARARYAESLEVLRLALASEVVDFEGAFWRFRDVPMEIRPYQQPLPPLWYAVGTPQSTEYPARNGFHVVCTGPTAKAREVAAHYRAARAEAGIEGPEPLIGMNRFVLVADSDDEARAIGEAAWPAFEANFYKLWRKHGTQPVNIRLPPTFQPLIDAGVALAGSPARVRETLLAQAADSGVTYMIGNFMFGTMPHEAARRSIELFAAEVMPAFDPLAPAPAPD